MSNLVFTPIDEQGLLIYQTWFNDAELSRRIEPPTRGWFDYVRYEPGYFAWMIYEDGIAVGQLQLDTYSNRTGSMALVVKPELRNRGYGTRILRAFLERAEVRQLNRIEATIEPDNIPALHCAKSVGFVQQSPEPDDEGFLDFVYNREHRDRPG